MRPRSRRVFVGVSLAALLATSSLVGQSSAASLPETAGRQQAAFPKPLKLDKKSLGDYVLNWDWKNPAGNSYQPLIKQLRKRVKAKKYATLPSLLDNAKHTATRGCASAVKDGGALNKPLKVPAVDWFCLGAKDANTTSWMPQGISGTSDSSWPGTVNGRRAFAFTWHYHVPNKKNDPLENGASRVTFLNQASVPGKPTKYRYRNVLMVYPLRTAKGDVTFRSVPIHAGGLVWFHQYLLVTDDSQNSFFNGVLVFDMHNLLDLANKKLVNTTNPNRVGLYKKTYYTLGYRYVLPLIGIWKTGGAAACHTESHRPCYEYAGLDRSASPPSLITGEWCDPGTHPCSTGRVARFRLVDTKTCRYGCLETRKDGRAHATRVYRQVSPYVQGGDSWGGKYQFTTSYQSWARRFSAIPNKKPKTFAAGRGAQDLYWNRTGGVRRLWSLTEFPGKGNRVLYGVKP
ncbi:hypothetical protein JOL79_20810 [Microbispora sp. RL4-1S]|uniref:Uncharacterized protein n=1 Tax=Microbispora oryzae TaxID=2806554 RepID=A0A941AJE9_9ACTN|nr:hypothetical protein [Microbispora oryzae]MBP2706255.1 hypothetical protein [Microbispora oryzae]